MFTVSIRHLGESLRILHPFLLPLLPLPCGVHHVSFMSLGVFISLDNYRFYYLHGFPLFAVLLYHSSSICLLSCIILSGGPFLQSSTANPLVFFFNPQGYQFVK